MAEGIEVRHSKGCRARGGGRCGCTPAYRAHLWSDRDRKRIRKTFHSRAEAKAWRSDAVVALRQGTLRSPEPTTLRAAAMAWLTGAESGLVRDRSGRTFKPSTIRTYRMKLDRYVLPALGEYRLGDIRRRDVQDLADAMLAAGLEPSTVRNAIDPLRSIYRRAMQRDQVAINPTANLALPSSRKARVQIATLAEARALLGTLPATERATWATAFYGGLRRGELQALRAGSIDLGASVIHIERSWDQEAGEIEPKSATSVRTVPLLAVLRDHIDQHLLRSGRRGNDLAFGRTGSAPFVPTTLMGRADRAWRAAGLKRITLHPARHTYASLLIAAGENPKAVQEFMGHAAITETFDTYGHLFPGSRDEARVRLDAYLEAELSRNRPDHDSNSSPGIEITQGHPSAPPGKRA
ncbi:MAG: tyrosine-type recombinase/integrase [Solirubrobacterales bacterium]